ncbi:hypothetical protein NE237_032776 [Protea cynaroides]|uniref:Uncharacterized protein n=1 Tax=Protea cynaroides TaxID=273540 RepID=A0A9Q0L4X1_9MAGN|nr:hypothetical protein NE237_032776 [Protea cynaroides]
MTAECKVTEGTKISCAGGVLRASDCYNGEIAWRAEEGGEIGGDIDGAGGGEKEGETGKACETGRRESTAAAATWKGVGMSLGSEVSVAPVESKIVLQQVMSL